MMVLTAVVLLVAFMALTAMLARVNTLGAETTRERDDPFPTEFASVRRGVDQIATQLLAGDPADDYEAAVQAALENVERIESRRGFWVDATATCNGSALDLSLQMQDAHAYAAASWSIDATGRCP